MALRHQLALSVLPAASRHVLVLQDVSQYVPGLAQQGGVLSIVPANAIVGSAPVLLTSGIAPGFTRIISPYELGYSTLGDYAQIMPDGVYELRYYFLPGDTLGSRVSHYRTANLQYRLDSLLVRFTGDCSMMTVLKDDKLAQLMNLQAYLSAIDPNQRCAQTGRASEIYNYVCERVSTLERSTQL